MFKGRKWEWRESVPEPEFDLRMMTLEVGREMPTWFSNALARKDITPVPEPSIGQYGWAGDGIMVKRTGCFFPTGSSMSKGDLFWPPV